MLFVPAAFAADSQIPRPPELQPAVDFWIRVYSEITTSQGFIHDQHELGVVYETVTFASGAAPADRQQQVDAAREHYQGILKHFAAGLAPADAEEQRVRALWPADTAAARFALAVDDVRFQLGQADRFRAGLTRSGVWETHIAEALANLGVPPELAALPHVESSFDPTAYSKVGAAGLWQFMRSTGRRFLRIDASVDERMDPFRATEAAAQLLAYNYRLLGSWPLAITAYNHGAAGMRRARDQLGTDDIVKIIRDYQSPSFGFASRNFYTSFLAALTIDQNPEKYFGPIQRESEAQFQELELPTGASISQLERVIGIPRDDLQKLNPALLGTVWSGRRAVPAGYHLRLPAATRTPWTTELLAQRLGSRPEALAAAAPTPVGGGNDTSYVVARGDTLSGIAAKLNVATAQLMAANDLRDTDHIFEGQRLRVSAAPVEPAEKAAEAAAVAETRAETKALVAAQKQERQATPVPDSSILASISRGVGTRRTAPRAASASGAVSADQSSPAATLAAGEAADMSADPVDYSVGADGTIRVAAAETIGHYADWLRTNAQQLRTLNKLGRNGTVAIGRRLTLPLKRVTAMEFEDKRREYHQKLQAEYFAVHRITGTEVYIARRGDSLWSLTQRNASLPVWLLQQYNPDLDFGDLRPGAQVILPRVEDLPGV
ncbi:MAG: transglycosylase SLT domain-containing protein [Steroidobacteraceae bacterium]